MAVGILAVMFALGTFSSQKAGAEDHGDVSLSLDTTKPGADVKATVMVDVPNLPPGATITVTLTGLDVPGNGVEAVIEDAMTWPLPTGVASKMVRLDTTAPAGSIDLGSTVSDDNARTVVLTVPDDTDEDSAAITVDHDNDPNTDPIQQGIAAGMIKIELMGTGFANPDMAANATATVATDVDGSGTTAAVELGTSDEVGTGVALSVDPMTAGSNAYVTIEVGLADGTITGETLLDEGDRLMFDLGSFGVPSSIKAGDVSVIGLNGNGDQAQRAKAEAVIVSGKKVTVVVPDMDDDTAASQGLSPHYRIVFAQAAGISVPSTSGSYSVKATLPGTTTEIASNAITVEESLTVSKKEGPSGTEVTVTGKGFKRDINSLFIDTRTDTAAPDGDPGNEEYVIASAITVDKGSFSRTFTIDSNFKTGLNYINTLDADGNSFSKVSDDEQTAIDAANKAVADATTPTDAQKAAAKKAVDDALEEGWVSFKLTGKMTVDKTSVRLGDKIEITLANFSDGEVISSKIGSKDLMVDTTGDDAQSQAVAGGKLTYTATVPPDLTIGSHRIRVTVDPTDADAENETGTVSVVVEGLPLTVSPSSAVPGQEITIRGTGFTANAAIATIKIGGREANLGSVPILVSSSGGVVATVSIPKTVSAEGSSVLVEVTENAPGVTNPGNSREGVMRITIPKETLTLDPVESRPETAVTASGTGFVAGANVTIMYNESAASVNADSSGNWTKVITVPINTPVGTSNTVKATNGVNNANEAEKEATATHKVPGGKVTFSPAQGQPGDSVTVSGDGFKAYSPVVKMTIGGLSVLTGAINTDANGDFTSSILIPALPAGTHSFFIGVGGTADAPTNRESQTFTVGKGAPAATATAKVFKDLIDAGNLERVYHYVNATATWLVFDPRPDFAEFNDYTESVSGQAVWVKVTNDAQFQGQSLFAGWNLIVLQ